DWIPFFLRAAGEALFGIRPEPTAEPKGGAVIILSGGAFLGATSRNRVSVRIGRLVAALGYHAVRLDDRGIGESSGEIDSYGLDRPFVDELLGAVAFMAERGVTEFVLVGTTCFGSR